MYKLISINVFFISGEDKKFAHMCSVDAKMNSNVILLSFKG